MRIESPKTLDRFRGYGKCELCGNAGYREVHHVFARGMDDAFRNDLAINLVSLCRVCHARAEQEAGMREECLKIISEREGISLDVLKTVLLRLRNA